MPGPIATEAAEAVVQRLTDPSQPPLVIKPVDNVPVEPGPGHKPFQVRDKAFPLFGTGAWWFQKGGPIGVICFLFIGSFVWLANAQRTSTNALIEHMQRQQESSNGERRQLTTILLNTQAEISANLARMARSVERLEAKIDGKK